MAASKRWPHSWPISPSLWVSTQVSPAPKISTRVVSVIAKRADSPIWSEVLSLDFALWMTWASFQKFPCVCRPVKSESGDKVFASSLLISWVADNAGLRYGHRLILLATWVCSVVSPVWLLLTPWTVARQAPLSTGSSRQEYQSGLVFPSPGDLPDPGIEPRSPARKADSLIIWATSEARSYMSWATTTDAKF